MDLFDVWRILNPTTKRYTWRKMIFTGVKQSRLAYIIIPKSFLYNVETIEIGHSIYSDHSPLLKTETSNQKGRGFWKFNLALLKDHEYVKKVNTLIETELNENRRNNKGLNWDTIKMKIRGLTISHACYKAKQTRIAEK